MTMFDRDAWLAQTEEKALEPDLPICDPHHHLWDYPGSRYLVQEFLRDVSGGHRLISTVFVECLQFYRSKGSVALRPVGETEFVEEIAGIYQTPHGPTHVGAGIVGFADLTQGVAVQPILEAHLAASSRFRGVRYASAWDASDQVHNAHTRPPPHLFGDSHFRAGAACLERMGLVFDAWLYHSQMDELIDFARALPGLTVVLDHMAGPLGIGPYAEQRSEIFVAWRNKMAELANCDNVYIKLGGRTMSAAGFGWHRRERPPGSVELAGVIGPYVRACIEQFGPERCMFESNFPVDRVSCSYTVLWNAFKRLSGEYSRTERADLLHDTASKVYRLKQMTTRD